jgi:hypothetical protein
MGGGRGGGYGGDTNSPLANNLRDLESKFPRSKNGNFGETGSRADVRRISSGDSQKSAKDFFRIAKRGSESVEELKPGVYRARFRDGSHVIYRRRSASDGSPVVEIVSNDRKSGRNRRQKIHFIEERKS